MKRSRWTHGFVWAAAGAAMLACTEPGADDGSSSSGMPEGDLDVFVIGTVHAPVGLLLDSSYSAAHIRAALDLFEPTAVGIEAPPLWNAWGVHFDATWEIDQVVLPWARDHSVPVYGIDWVPIEDLASRAQARFRSFRESLTSPPTRLEELRDRAAQRAEAVLASRLDDFADPERRHGHEWFTWINTGARSQATPVRVWWETRGSNDPGGNAASAAEVVDFIRARHERIIHQVEVLRERSRNGRLAILIGYSHKPDLDQKLSELAGVRVVQLGDLAGFTDEAVAASWRPADAIATLREGLDGSAFYLFPDGVDGPLVRQALEAYRASGEETLEGRYFSARVAALSGDTSAAVTVLEALLQELAVGPAIQATYETVPTLQQRVRVELGRLRDLSGDRSAALFQYREALRALEEAIESVPVEESFPSITDWAAGGYEAAQHLTTLRAYREMLLALLTQPWVSREG